MEVVVSARGALSLWAVIAWYAGWIIYYLTGWL